MGTFYRQIRSIVVLMAIQVGLFYFVFGGYKVADYAFLWAAIYIFAFLLKIFNLGGDSSATPMGRGAGNSIKLALASSIFPKQSRSRVTTEKEDRYDLINLGVLAIINVAIVFILG